MIEKIIEEQIKLLREISKSDVRNLSNLEKKLIEDNYKASIETIRKGFEVLENLSEVLENLRIHTNEAKREVDEFLEKIEKVKEFIAELVLLSAKNKNYSEVIKHLSVLRDYAREEERKEIDRLIEELKFRAGKDMEFSDELVERIKVLVYRVKVGKKR